MKQEVMSFLGSGYDTVTTDMSLVQVVDLYRVLPEWAIYLIIAFAIAIVLAILISIACVSMTQLA